MVYCLLCTGIFAQSSKKDTIYLTIYNTGGKYMLKRAPYGEQLPKTDSIKEMVVAVDSFTTKEVKVAKNFVPKTNAEIEKLAPSKKTKPDEPVKPSDADIAKAKTNAAKRTCFISQKDLKGKIVLIDYDKGCDQTDKCLQAQKAGAAGIVIIYDPTKKDSDDLQSEEYDNDMKIPVFAVTSKQGDSIRMHLPSRVALYIKKPKATTKTQSLMTDTTDNRQRTTDNGQRTLDNGLQTTDNGQQTSEIGVSAKDALNFQLNGGVSDNSTDSRKISVSPNPAKDFLEVRNNFDGAQSVRVTAINAGGVSVYSQLIGASSGIHKIDTSEWESGVYMIAIDKEGSLLHMEKAVVAH